MKNVLVTGGAGFIGSNFVRFLLRKRPNVQVVTLDALTYAGSRENLKNLPGAERHRFVEGDVLDEALALTLLREHAIDTVVHFAAESHVDRSILGPRPFMQTNVMGTFTLLEAARTVWIEEAEQRADAVRFHHVSTDEVYGTLAPREPAFSEETPYAPRSPYAASKAASDHLVRSYSHTYGLPISISNCSNNYGPYQFPEKLIPLMLFNALAGRPLPLYGDGQQVRDWLYVEDHCAAICEILAQGAPGQTYNVGGGNQPTNLAVVETLCRLLDEAVPDAPHAPHSALIAFVEDRPGHDRRYAMDTAKIERELGWAPQESLESGLRKTVAWYLDHLDWASAVHEAPAHQRWLARNYEDRTSST